MGARYDEATEGLYGTGDDGGINIVCPRSQAMKFCGMTGIFLT
jgi:hypothetical protein